MKRAYRWTLGALTAIGAGILTLTGLSSAVGVPTLLDCHRVPHGSACVVIVADPPPATITFLTAPIYWDSAPGVIVPRATPQLIAIGPESPQAPNRFSAMWTREIAGVQVGGSIYPVTLK